MTQDEILDELERVYIMESESKSEVINIKPIKKINDGDSIAWECV